MTESIIPLRFNVQDVGKHVKSSKKRFTWQISLNGKQHSIILQFSFISGKVKVTVNRKILIENQLPANTSFQYPFTLDGNSLNVIQQGESFELRINNKVFSHLYNQAKTNKQFKKYEDEIKDFKVDENQFHAKKITLNIGGVGGGMKKKAKNQSGEMHNWNAFGEDELSGFPNYFEGQPMPTASLSKEEPTKNMQTKSNSLLDVDQGMSLSKNSAKNQNILDFEAQLQSFPSQSHQSANKASQQFSNMQLIFQTMSLNQKNKPSMIINSNEADIFNSSQEKKPKQGQPQLDFFADLNNNQTVSTPPLVTQTSPQNFHTLQYMFATNQAQSNNFSNSLFQQSNPQTNNPGLNMGFNTEINPNTQNTKPLQSQVNSSNSSTLQGLFATNPINFNQTATVGTTVAQPQTNFSLNPHQFTTQGISNKGSNASLNINTQQFGTQNFMGHQGFGQQINFLQQSKAPTMQQSVVMPQPVVKKSEEINIKDFNSIQLLFQTNTVQPGTEQGNQAPVQKSYVDALNQQFSTMVTPTMQYPNSMLMNTYGGSSNQGTIGLDLNMNFNQQQFSTSVNPPMMKKQSLTPTPVVQSSINTGELL